MSVSQSRSQDLADEPNSAFLGVSLRLPTSIADASQPQGLRDRSALIARLSWSAMQPVIEEIRADAFVDSPITEDPSASSSRSALDAPERWIAVIPENRRDLAEACVTRAQAAWRESGEEASAGENLEIHTIVTPWRECSPDVISELLGDEAAPATTRDALFEARLAIALKTLDAKQAFPPIPPAAMNLNPNRSRVQTRRDEGWTTPSRYAIAAIRSDRAPIGREARRAAATAWSAYAMGSAPAVIERHGGLLIQTHVEETIFAAPSATALACAADLARAWREAAENARDSRTDQVSLSGGLVIIDHPGFARSGLRQARTACRIAKEQGGDGLRVSLEPGAASALEEDAESSKETAGALISWDTIAELLELTRKAVGSGGGEHQTFVLQRDAALASSLPWSAAIAEISRLAFGAASIPAQNAIASFLQSLRRDWSNRSERPQDTIDSPSSSQPKIHNEPPIPAPAEESEIGRLALVEGMRLLIFAIHAQRSPESPRRLRA